MDEKHYMGNKNTKRAPMANREIRGKASARMRILETRRAIVSSFAREQKRFLRAFHVAIIRKWSFCGLKLLSTFQRVVRMATRGLFC